MRDTKLENNPDTESEQGTLKPSGNGEIFDGDLDFDGRIILYIIKGHCSPLTILRPRADGWIDDAADQTSYINYIKPLILAEELQFPYVISLVDTKDEWYSEAHPERYVPSLRDEDPATRQKIYVFESTACLQYLADRFDDCGLWRGRRTSERAVVLSWTAFQTAGLG